MPQQECWNLLYMRQWRGSLSVNSRFCSVAAAKRRKAPRGRSEEETQRQRVRLRQLSKFS